MTTKELIQIEKDKLTNFKGDKRSKEYKELKKSVKLQLHIYEHPDDYITEDVLSYTISIGDAPTIDTQEQPKPLLIESEPYNPFKDLSVLEDLKKVRRHYRKIDEFTEEQYNILVDNLPEGNRITGTEQKNILSVYNELFKTKKKASSCAACVRSVIKMLKPLVDHYKVL